MAISKTKKTSSKTTASKTTTKTAPKDVKAKAVTTKETKATPKTTKATKPAKTSKAAKATKPAKAVKTAKATKPAKATKTTKATKSAKATKTTKVAKAAKAKTTKTTTKNKATKAKKTKNVVVNFLGDINKQATKVQKQAQVETKVWIKKLNTQDKQLSQLTKKADKAKGKSRAGADKKIEKLQNEMSDTRTGLLNAENSLDKIATLIEYVNQLSNKQSVASYLPKPTSKPTLVKNSTSSKKTAPVAQPFEEEDYLEESDNDDEMNFLFGEDDDEEVSR